MSDLKTLREFNFNHYVWVRLQRRGLEAIAAEPFQAAVHKHREQDGEWTRWQLWDLMATLGELCYMGPEPPFNPVIRFQLDATPPPPVAGSRATHCVNCGASWLDDGLNKLSCPYCEVASRDREIEGLKRDIEFKDEQIWVGRSSELYRSTFEAEQKAKRLEAELSRLRSKLAEVKP